MTIQQILAIYQSLYVKHKMRSRSFTKKGPGRLHQQGKKKKET